MHKFSISSDVIDRVQARSGKAHPFDNLDPHRTALLVIDLQNYFLKPVAQGETASARAIVPTVNELAAALRRRGGHVVWIRNDGRHAPKLVGISRVPDDAGAPAAALQGNGSGGDGFEFWHALEIRPGDGKIEKRFSAFIQGSSPLLDYLHGRNIDTVLIAGTATNVCCESTARDAMMLNFKTIMVSDALAARSDELHAASLTAFYPNFGDVQNSAEVLELLDRGA